MILTTVSIVITINNSLNNKPMLSSEVMITLNGVRHKYIYKQNGIFVFVNLADGEYSVKISSRGFQDEEYNVKVDSSKCVELLCGLNPAINYPFIGDITKIYLNAGALYKGKKIYLVDENINMKIAQDKVFEKSFKLYSYKKASSFPFPHLYFIDDAENSEIIEIAEFENETALLVNEFVYSHKRGTKVFGVNQYIFDDNGRAFITTRKPKNLRLLRYINDEYVFLSPEVEKNKLNEIDWLI